MEGLAKRIARRLLPPTVANWLGAQGRWVQARLHGDEPAPPRGLVRFGSLRRLTPLDRMYGGRRGLPIDRYYIEGFLERHAGSIRGRVLEIGDSYYTRRFGGDRVTRSEVLHAVEGNPEATLVADLSRADHLPSDAFDCIVFTQTLHLIYDFRAALSTLHRILAPGGTVFATFPGITQISRPDMDSWGQYWSFTSLSARRCFEETFPGAQVEVEAHGNVLVASAFLFGLAVQELRRAELDHHDPDYEFLITVRVVKPGRPG
ncbi:MAG TPA: methyltransferase domain-containing protein [Longimicrobiaceae bacterium]|nr:methyltransferase domain-containing protein [Longimicrobiaceae bacterium]